MSESPNKTKPTPGPWRPNNAVIETKDGIALQIAIAAPADRVGMAPRSRPEQLANARLIAAAPELLDVVRKAMIDLEDCMEHSAHLPEQVRANATASIEQARAIIAKAEGLHV